jgi:pyridoxine kinase
VSIVTGDVDRTKIGRQRLIAVKHANRQLSKVKITDSASLRQAVEVLHTKYNVPHVVITSVSIPLKPDSSSSSRTMSVVGSSRTSTGQARLFKIHFPIFDCYFSGSGDMFAALMVVRMREAVFSGNGSSAKDAETLQHTASWLSPDAVAPLALPLARAAEKVLASMHEVLSRTCEAMKPELERGAAALDAELQAAAASGALAADAVEPERARRLHLLRSRAAELRLVRNLPCLRMPNIEYRAEIL